ncbi:MAG: hypothetical protein ACI94Y_000904 [Maribacter sp.]|jgi:hypothetical protein
MLRSISFLFAIIFISNCSNTLDQQPREQDSTSIEREIIKGISLVAPPAAFKENPMTAIKQVNAEWLAVIPYAYCGVGNTDIVFNVNSQWWGEKEEGVLETIRIAKKSGLKVMLKPQIWVPNSWTGGITFDNEKDWEAWQKSYTDYLMFYVNRMKSMDVDMICIGTELKQTEVERAKYWRGLIQDIKKDYDGELTYASNWDSYAVLPFWDELDYIGVDAYFPLDESQNPDIEVLKKKWQLVHKELKSVSQKFKRPILFTEFGYMSVDGCAGKTWELEKNSRNLVNNEQAQADALIALFDFFDDQPYWGGGFLWKWYGELGVHQDHGNNGHTPQGKIAEDVVKEWYGKMK